MSLVIKKNYKNLLPGDIIVCYASNNLHPLRIDPYITILSCEYYNTNIQENDKKYWILTVCVFIKKTQENFSHVIFLTERGYYRYYNWSNDALIDVIDIQKCL